MKENNTTSLPLDKSDTILKDTKNKGDIPEISLDLEDLKQEIKIKEEQFQKVSYQFGILAIKPAKDWLEDASKRPIPQMLFDSFWYEGEICILFADTNLGKSILAVQIANSISKGKAIQGFLLETNAQQVLYMDFELSDKQFENRYSKDYKDHYDFGSNFYRAEINSECSVPNNMTFETFLINSLVQYIESTGIKIIIIDNLTYLKNETEKAKNALPLMKLLKDLKNKYKLSLLILAHTPKRDLSKPISRNDLQGSKMLINFCDSCFAIGESTHDTGKRYLKQIKVRNSEFKYDTNNIAICQIEKPHNFLGFHFVEYGEEQNHLKQLSSKDKLELEQAIIQLKADKPSFSNREIAKQLGTNHTKVGRVLKKHE